MERLATGPRRRRPASGSAPLGVTAISAPAARTVSWLAGDRVAVYVSRLVTAASEAPTQDTRVARTAAEVEESSRARRTSDTTVVGSTPDVAGAGRRGLAGPSRSAPAAAGTAGAAEPRPASRARSGRWPPCAARWWGSAPPPRAVRRIAAEEADRAGCRRHHGSARPARLVAPTDRPAPPALEARRSRPPVRPRARPPRRPSRPSAPRRARAARPRPGRLRGRRTRRSRQRARSAAGARSARCR